MLEGQFRKRKGEILPDFGLGNLLFTMGFVVLFCLFVCLFTGIFCQLDVLQRRHLVFFFLKEEQYISSK